MSENIDNIDITHTPNSAISKINLVGHRDLYKRRIQEESLSLLPQPIKTLLVSIHDVYNIEYISLERIYAIEPPRVGRAAFDSLIFKLLLFHILILFLIVFTHPDISHWTPNRLHNIFVFDRHTLHWNRSTFIGSKL